ncbi:hypothetical protein Vretimale_178 [Volvox reticuliferus]|uniref:Uncharacterized protein n=1 Tax=Volvox reticuliferus TaxID=1737510 RepID=A0A8J4D753_9CHLO|nr:hypothetical protein Vretimale_178 [Volvox reticuliferus]
MPLCICRRVSGDSFEPGLEKRGADCAELNHERGTVMAERMAGLGVGIPPLSQEAAHVGATNTSFGVGGLTATALGSPEADEGTFAWPGICRPAGTASIEASLLMDAVANVVDVLRLLWYGGRHRCGRQQPSPQCANYWLQQHIYGLPIIMLNRSHLHPWRPRQQAAGHTRTHC